MASTFGWTLNEIKHTSIDDLEYITEGSNLYVGKQNEEYKKAAKSKGGKVSIDSIGQLKGLPGVKTMKKKR